VVCDIEHSPGCALAADVGEEDRTVQSGQSPGVPRLHERRAGRLARDTHHTAGHPRSLHQDHQRTAHRHDGQPAQGSRQLQPGTPARILRAASVFRLLQTWIHTDCDERVCVCLSVWVILQVPSLLLLHHRSLQPIISLVRPGITFLFPHAYLRNHTSELHQIFSSVLTNGTMYWQIERPSSSINNVSQCKQTTTTSYGRIRRI